MEFPPIRTIMWFFWFVAMCATLFASIVIISSSTDPDVNQDLSWAKGTQTGGGLYLYVGVFNFVTKISSGGFTSAVTSVKWDDSSCSVDFCDDCYRNMAAAIALALFSLVLTFPTLYTDFARTTAGGNNATNQMIGASSSILSMVAGIVSVILFAAGCLNKIKNESTGVSWRMGPAFGLMIATIVFKFVDALANLILPVEGADGGGDSTRSGPGSAASSNKRNTQPVSTSEEDGKSEKMINQV